MVKASKEPVDQEKIMKHLGPLAGTLKSSAKALWKVFVWRYIAKGVAELIIAVFMDIFAIHILKSSTSAWLFIPFTINVVLIYDGVINLINPAYPAMNDAIEHVSELKGDIKKNVYTLLGQ